jgi:hypothetical protein
MIKNIQSIMIYIIVIILVTIGYIILNSNREELLSRTMKDTLQTYFENNNSHIASYDFSINDIKIKCRGNNAYLVEFNMILDEDTAKKFNKLGAIIYKKNNIWQVKGFGSGFTIDELESYNFRCYN